jgi:hypothetical protein
LLLKKKKYTFFQESEPIIIQIINKYKYPIFLYFHIYEPNGNVFAFNPNPKEGRYTKLDTNHLLKKNLTGFHFPKNFKHNIGMFTLKVIVTTNAKIWLQDNPLENCIKNSANLQCVMEKKFYLLKNLNENNNLIQDYKEVENPSNLIIGEAYPKDKWEIILKNIIIEEKIY